MRNMRAASLSFNVPGEGSRRLGLIGVAAVLIVVFGSSYSNFLTASNGKAILVNISAIAIAGIGAAALLISGNVDLSIGTQWAFNGMVVGIVARDTQNPFYAVCAGLALGLAMGLTNGFLVRWLKISPLIVTLATNLLWGGLAFVVTSGQPVFGFPNTFIEIGTATIAGVPTPVLVAAVMFIVGGVYLVASVPGLRVYAIGGNAEAARLTGVRVERYIVSLYALNSLLVAVVAILTTARLSSAAPQVGLTFSLDVLTAIILGGVAFTGGSGHPLGVLIGILTLGILDAGLVFGGFEDWYQQMARGGVLLLALVADQVLANQRAGGRLQRKRNDTTTETEMEMPIVVARQTGELLSETSVLRCEGLSRSYGAVNAVSDVDFGVRAGEVVCLVGDNGAGKSTLVKMISGAIRPGSGHVTLDGRQLPLGDPAAVREAGIQTVFQDLALCPNLSVVHNLVLGDEPRQGALGWLRIRDDREAGRRSNQRLDRFGVRLQNPRQVVRLLSGGQRQSVSIARALKKGTRLIILDEPTAALGVRQTAKVLNTIRSAADEGTAILLISHDLETVFAVADRVVVLRQGRVIHDGPRSALTQARLVHMMAGLLDPHEMQEQSQELHTRSAGENGHGESVVRL